jgi:hypothetical protein
VRGLVHGIGFSARAPGESPTRTKREFRAGGCMEHSVIDCAGHGRRQANPVVVAAAA